MRGLWRLKMLGRAWQAHRDLSRAKRTVSRFPVIATKRPHGLSGEVVVSLTSYPARFQTLHLTLRSLLDQTVAVDRTVLWIAEKDAPLLPEKVRSLAAHGLEIKTCADIGSYKKLVPALLHWPEATIITADDDLYYHHDWAAELVDTARREPGKIIAHRVHLSLLGQDLALLPYLSWVHCTKRRDDDPPNGLLFPTTGAGVLYPPASLDAHATDVATFMELCPTADDIWFFWMARLVDSEMRGMGRVPALVTWNGSQDEALHRINVDGRANDRQIALMTSQFGKPWTADRRADNGIVSRAQR